MLGKGVRSIESKWHTSDYDTELIKVDYNLVPEHEAK